MNILKCCVMCAGFDSKVNTPIESIEVYQCTKCIHSHFWTPPSSVNIWRFGRQLFYFHSAQPHSAVLQQSIWIATTWSLQLWQDNNSTQQISYDVLVFEASWLLFALVVCCGLESLVLPINVWLRSENIKRFPFARIFFYNIPVKNPCNITSLNDR